VHVDATAGTVSIELSTGAPGGASIERAVPRVYVDGRWASPADYPGHAVSTGDDSSTTLTLSGASALPDLVLELRASDDGRGVLSRLTARNSTSSPRVVEGFEWGVRPGEGGWARIGDDPASSTQWIQGQNSWSFVGTVKVAPGVTGADGSGRVVPDEQLFRIGNNNLTDTSGIELLLRGQDAIPLSWWNTVIQAPGGAGALLAGAVSAARFKTSVLAGFDPAISAMLPREAANAFTALRIVCGFTGDRLSLAPGAELDSEELLIAAYPSGLQALAAHAQMAGTRIERLPRSTEVPKLRLGWSSWSGFFTDISESSLIDQAMFIAKNLASSGYQVVQLDDGYETGWGDWRMNEKFPSDYSGVASQIRSLGLVPGIWIAPFLADESLPIVTEHPDWFLTGNDGNPVVFSSAFFGFRRRTIDVTNPAAADFVRGNLARIRDAGIGLVKADFLFGASYEGRHFDPTVTGLEAYHQGLRLIRDTLGPDVTIIGIAGPWLATAGAVDYYRQSNDVETRPPGPAWPFFESEALGTSARSYAHETFFRSDPDHVLVDPKLSTDEARAVASYVALCGGLWFSGDVVTELPAERLALLQNRIYSRSCRKDARRCRSTCSMPRPARATWHRSSPTSRGSCTSIRSPRSRCRPCGSSIATTAARCSGSSTGPTRA